MGAGCYFLMKTIKLFKKIPGFRSGSKIKAVIASVFYLFLLLFILGIVIPTDPTLALDEFLPTNQNQTKISGKTFAGRPLWLLKDNQVIIQTKAGSRGEFELEVKDLTEGENKFTVKVCHEEEQKHCTEKEIVIIVDKTSPQPPTIEDFPQETEQEKIKIKGLSERESKVKVFVNGEEKTKVETTKNGNFEVEIDLFEGNNRIEATAIDKAGNQSEPSEEIRITYIKPLEPTPTPTPKPTPTPTPKPTPEVKGEKTPQEPALGEQEILVIKVIDGDTIKLVNGEVVRYIGIDTPETVHPSKPVQCFGHEASQKNKELVEGKMVRLEKDISERDKYGRLLRDVWVGDIFVNEYLVRQGYAQVYTYPPDVKYQDLFLQAQREARENNRGLWGACMAEPIPTSSKPPEGSPSDCSSNIYNCSDFQYQEDAQYVFEYCGGVGNDVHRLDSDKDGIACESLPRKGSITTETTTPQTPSGGGGGYTCNCSKTCSQMSSCEEAYFQLNNCGCSARDGDKDGVPCESICR